MKNNKLYRTMLGGEWIKSLDGKWIRPPFPLVTRKFLTDNAKYCQGEKYPHSLLAQNYKTLQAGTIHASI